MAQGIDCATPLTPELAAAFAADGKAFVCRYLVPSGFKRLTRQEAEVLTAADLQIVSVFETTADRALGGRFAGLIDGAAALQVAREVGQPLGSAIYPAVDFQPTPGQIPLVLNYLRAFGEAIPGYVLGMYGSYDVVEAAYAAGVCSHFWQTRAWSGGRRHPAANIYQYDCGPTGAGLMLHGIGVDLNESFGGEGWWSLNENEKEDVDNMPMKLEDWQWDMLYQVMGKAYNKDQLQWDWMQKIVDKTLTASELAFLNTVLDGRIDRDIQV